VQTNIEYPKIIWKYWGTTGWKVWEWGVPYKINQINNNLIKQSKENKWEVHLLTDMTIFNYINKNDLPRNFYKLGIQHQADYYRMYLLEKYGGVWMDASIIINDFSKIEELYQRSVDSKSQLTVFKKKYEWAQDERYPIIENWFILAPINSPVIAVWFNEYKKAIDMDFEQYRASIQNDKVNIQGIYSTYHIQHLGIQKVLQKDLGPHPPIIVETADESMLLIEASCKGNEECISEKINNKEFIKTVPYIKLNGRLRDKINLNDYFENFNNV